MLPAAYVVLGETGSGKLWLARATADNALEQAWMYGLESEIRKSEGDKVGALAAIDLAIAVLGGEQPQGTDRHEVERRLRSYRQDRARILQYLFYKTAEAADEYEALLREWDALPGAIVDVATVRRNFSECLRTLSDGKKDARWQRARDLLDTAIEDMRHSLQRPILGELYYERARIALADGELEYAREVLAECLLSADRSGHGMLHAIARARVFWQFEPFDLKEWRKVNTDLVPYARHGWAARTLMRGRLRAARRLDTVAAAVEQVELLKSNLTLIGQHPSFSEGSDRFRIAATFAGLSLCDPSRDWWTEFKERHAWASAWLATAAMGDGSVASVWARVD